MTALTEAQRATLMQVGGNKLELNLKMHIYFTKSVKIMLVLKIQRFSKASVGLGVSVWRQEPVTPSLRPWDLLFYA